MPEKTLVVVIPAYNERDTVGSVISSVPRDLSGVSSVRVLVVDDGSTDDTVEQARACGADMIFSFKRNCGLARAFKKGIDLALEENADYIISMDADGQYDCSDMGNVLVPLVEGKADVVLTDRRIWSLDHMPWKKKIGNHIATSVLSYASGMKVKDGQSGFRGFTRDAAMRLNIQSRYTYVGESIIQLAKSNYKIAQVPVKFYERKGESRLISGIFAYAYRASHILIMTYLFYNALRTFLSAGISLMFLGFLLGLRFLYYFVFTGGSGNVQSLILASILIVLGFQIVVLGLVAELINSNRRIIEDLRMEMKER